MSRMSKVLLVLLITIIICIPIIYVAYKITVQGNVKLTPQLSMNYDVVYGRLPLDDDEYVFVIGTSGKIEKHLGVRYGCILSTELATAPNRVEIKEEYYSRICGKHKYDNEEIHIVGILKVKSGKRDILKPCKLYRKDKIAL